VTSTNEAEAHLLNLHKDETAAREILSPMVFDFVAGGADEVTVRGNRSAFDHWRLLPQELPGARGLDGDGAWSGRGAASADRARGAAPAVPQRRRARNGAGGESRRHHLHFEHRCLD
jgi:hypothetical protein